jgi:hypothetical protein
MRDWKGETAKPAMVGLFMIVVVGGCVYAVDVV